MMHGESDPEPGIMITKVQTNKHAEHLSDRQASEPTASLADMQGPGQRALFRGNDCMLHGTKQHSLRRPACLLMRVHPRQLEPSSPTDTQALTISRQSAQSAACYQLSNWISGTNVITAGVFIYIIIITALPRGAGGEQ